MASAKKAPPSDLETLTPPINLDGTRPVPPSPEQAAIDAENQQLVDDALAGRIKHPSINYNPDFNPSNPYAGEGYDPNWRPPTEKDVAAAVGDAIVDAVPVLKTWGAPEEKPKEEEPKGEIAYVDRADGAGSGRAAAPVVVPAYEISLVSPERHRAEQDAYAHIQSGYIDQRAALEKQKDAEDEVAQARIAQNNARAEGDKRVADVADQARWNTEARALEEKDSQNAFRAKMEAFSRDLAEDKIEYRTSLPQQITWGIARALGAVQQGLLHLPTNQVADQIDAHIKQALDIKKANHAIKRERLGDMQKFYDLAASQSKDQGERARLAYGYALEAAKAEAMALANATGNPLALAEAKKIQAALDEKSAQIETVGEYGTELAAAQAAIRNHKWVQAAGGASKPVDSKSVFFDPITKKYYSARNEKSREKLTQSGATVLETKEAIKNYEEALKKVGKLDKLGNLVGYDTDALADADTAWTIVSASLRKGTNEGTWKKSQEEQILKQLKPPSAFTGNPVTQMRIVQKTIDDLHAANMQVEAASEVDAVPQPYGTPPKSIPTGENYKQPKKVKPSAVGFEPVGAKAKGGDVGGNQPYLVGEEGPELVVPNKPGFVLTALQTAALRGAPPTKQQMDTLPKGTPKSAIQRFAEKAGVARADGGEVDDDDEIQWTKIGRKGWGRNLYTLADKAEEAKEALSRREPRRPREAVVEGATRAPPERRWKEPESFARNRKSYMTEDGEPLSEAEAIRYHEARRLRSSPRPPEWLERHMVAEGLAVPAREDGGALTPEDEEEIRRFMSDGKDTVVFEKPKTPEEAEQARQKAEAERREGERLQRQSIEDAKRRQRELEWAEYDEAHPIKAKFRDFFRRVLPASMTTQEARRARGEKLDEIIQSLYDDRPEMFREEGEQLNRKFREVGIRPPRQPVTFVRDTPTRADGGEVLPLYEPEGKELHQSLDGHAFYASNDPEPTRASLSGPTPRYSVPVRAEHSAHASPPPRRKPTPEELKRMADALARDMREEHEARMARGPAVNARACGGAVRPKGLAASISRDLEKTKRRG